MCLLRVMYSTFSPIRFYMSPWVFSFPFQQENLKKKSKTKKKGRISSKTNNRHFKNFVSVGTILIFDFCKKLTFFSSSFFHFWFLPIYPLCHRLSLSLSLSFRCLDCFFVLFCFWLKDLSYIRATTRFASSHRVPSFCMPICVCLRVECVWLNIFEELCLGGRGWGRNVSLYLVRL